MKQVSRKKQYFWKKLWKPHLWEDMTVLRGGEEGCLATKINITFFVDIEVLNIFHLTTFSKKTIFPKITGNKHFWGHDLLWGTGTSDDKNEYNLFWGKWGTGYSFKVFSPENPIPSDWNPKNWFWGHIFLHISEDIYRTRGRGISIENVDTESAFFSLGLPSTSSSPSPMVKSRYRTWPQLHLTLDKFRTMSRLNCPSPGWDFLTSVRKTLPLSRRRDAPSVFSRLFYLERDQIDKIQITPSVSFARSLPTATSRPPL